MLLEIFGYIGSALVVISMLMSSIVKLRVINLVGSIISCIYALIIGAMPLAIMNICLIIINAINLWKLARMPKDEAFDLIEDDSRNRILQSFLQNYQSDIQTFFPDYKPDSEAPQKAFLVCLKGAPIGVLLGNASGDAFDVQIDYSTPFYRDCSVGRFLYAKLPDFGVHTLRFSRAVSDGHKGYLEKMGFKPEGEAWTLKL